jgi:hypothetical protein
VEELAHFAPLEWARLYCPYCWDLASVLPCAVDDLERMATIVRRYERLLAWLWFIAAALFVVNVDMLDSVMSR